MISTRRALVVSFDQFPASILGCYGNEWIETPHLDRLAATGFIADACYAASVGNQSACGASKGVLSEVPCLRRGLVQEAGSQLDVAGFDRLIEIDGERGPSVKPDRIPLAEMVRCAKAIWADDKPELLWLHARGLTIPAAPPAGFAELYLDEFEDRGVKFTDLSAEELANHPLVTAGMASLVDHWLGELFAAISTEPDTLIVVTAACGAAWQPLPNSFGELDELRSQAVHVPWIVSNPGITARRIQEPMSSRQLGPLLATWFQGASELPAPNAEPIITRGSAFATRIVTGEWSAIFPGDGESDGVKPLLFAKPEDYWEVNNLAEVSPEVVEKLRRSVFQ